MSVLERHAMEEANVKMVSMTTLANAIWDTLAKTAKQVSNYSKPLTTLIQLIITNASLY